MTIGELEQHFFQDLRPLYSPVLQQRLFDVLGHHFLSLSGAQLRVHRQRVLSQKEQRVFATALRALRRGIPIAHILGQKTFYERLFLVNPSVLIPREETEDLISLALNETSFSTCVDIGTGSGAIGITLKKERPAWDVFASDVSEKALVVAKKNARRHKVTLRWFRGSLLHTELKTSLIKQNKPVLLVANLPYLPLEDKEAVHPSVKQEPALALYSGNDGLAHYRRLFSQLSRWKWAKSHGWTLLCEYDPPQTKTILSIAKTCFPKTERHVFQDRFGRTRFLRLCYLPDSTFKRRRSSVTT